MDIRFLPHNSHRETPRLFRERDPQLRHLQGLPLTHRPPLLDQLPLDSPGIYILGGGRQVGKTTLLKLWMAQLLDQGCPPESLLFLSGELIDDHHSLLRHLQEALAEMPDDQTVRLILDEVTYIRDWDRAVKYAADAGLLDRTVLMITGSDLALLQTARAHFPGRRGHENVVDFHLRPLSFRETFALEHGDDALQELAGAETDEPAEAVETAFAAFDRYLAHGGYLTAINDIATGGAIRVATLATYADWIRGDVSKSGKSEHFLREILGAILRRIGTQVTWNSLVKELSIDHPKTVADYMELLTSMDAVFIQPALIEDRLVGAPKKARKIMFTDPFIFHAIQAWIKPTADPYADLILPTLGEPSRAGRLAEAVAATHYARHWPTYYIKGSAGEVDVAWVAEGGFWPVEIKWSESIRPKDLKQIKKYPNGRILTRSRSSSTAWGLPTTPLPLALLKLKVDSSIPT
ncbi:MAG: ATP-binding protein [Thermoanaerobaculales bacterium]